MGQGELRASQSLGTASFCPLQPRDICSGWQLTGCGWKLLCRGGAAEPYSIQSICSYYFELFPASAHRAFPSLPPHFGARAVSLVPGSHTLSITAVRARAKGCRRAVL